MNLKQNLVVTKGGTNRPWLIIMEVMKASAPPGEEGSQLKNPTLSKPYLYE